MRKHVSVVEGVLDTLGDAYQVLHAADEAPGSRAFLPKPSSLNHLLDGPDATLPQ